MTLHESLRAVLVDAATALALPYCFDGDPFVVPAASFIRCRVVYGDARAASIGADAPTRTDGHLEIRCHPGMADGNAAAYTLAVRVKALFPRGRTIGCDAGETVCATPSVGTLQTDSARVAVVVSVPFYAITQGV